MKMSGYVFDYAGTSMMLDKRRDHEEERAVSWTLITIFSD
jgi:hypothetical protein